MSISFYVCRYLNNERQANKIATRERKKGPEQWGVKKKFISKRMSQDTIDDKERNFDDSSFRTGDIGGSSMNVSAVN